MTETVLVTGAGGFIGSHLAEELARQGYRVKAFVHYNSFNDWGWLEHTDKKLLSKMEVICGDICDYRSVSGAMRGCQKVFHLAALIGIPYSYCAPQSYVDTNIKGTLNILEAARDNAVKKVVHTSTSETYGTAQFVPITEKHPVNPQSPYAASKASADFLALSYWRSFGLPVAVVRPFNTYGPRQSARAVIPTIITQILAGKNIKLGSLLPTRDLTFVKDTARGFILAGELKSAVGQVINLGNNSEISIGDLAQLIAEIMGKKIKINRSAERVRPQKSEVERLWADNDKAQKLLGWSPQYSLKEGLAETIKWFKQNGKTYKAGIYNV